MFRIFSVLLLLTVCSAQDRYKYNEKLLKIILKTLEEREIQPPAIFEVEDYLDQNLPLELNVDLISLDDSTILSLVEFTKNAAQDILLATDAQSYTDCLVIRSIADFLKKHIKPLISRIQNSFLSEVAKTVLTQVDDVKILDDAVSKVPEVIKGLYGSARESLEKLKSEDPFKSKSSESESSESEGSDEDDEDDQSYETGDPNPTTTRDVVALFLYRTSELVKDMKAALPDTAEATIKCQDLVTKATDTLRNREVPDFDNVINDLQLPAQVEELLKDAAARLSEALPDLLDPQEVLDKILTNLETSSGVDRLSFILEKHSESFKTLRETINMVDGTNFDLFRLQDLPKDYVVALVTNFIESIETKVKNPDCSKVKYFGALKGVLTLMRISLNESHNEELRPVLKTVVDALTNLFGSDRRHEVSKALTLGLSIYFRNALQTITPIDETAEILPFDIVFMGIREHRSEDPSSSSTEEKGPFNGPLFALTLAATFARNLDVPVGEICPLQAVEDNFNTALQGLLTKVSTMSADIRGALCGSTAIDCTTDRAVIFLDHIIDTAAQQILYALTLMFPDGKPPKEFVTESLGHALFEILQDEKLKGGNFKNGGRN